MNTASHVLMGKLLYEHVKEKFGIFLEKDTFIFGNVLPDFSLSFLTRPHFIEKNLTYVQKEILNLTSTKQESVLLEKNYSKYLGIICHYYADFFCYAHSHHFPHSIALHIKYESGLYQYFKKNHCLISGTATASEVEQQIDVETIYSKFNQLHTKYLQLTPSYHHDLSHCFLACVEAILLITSLSITGITNEAQPHRQALRAV